MKTTSLHVLLLTAVVALVAPATLAAETISRMSREEALVAVEKAKVAIKASQAAIDAAAEAKRDEVVVKAKKLLEQNRQKLADAEAMLHAIEVAEDPMRDPLFVAAALDNAKKEASAAFAVSIGAAAEAAFSPDQAARAFDEAWVRFLNARQIARDLRTKKQEFEQPQLRADIQQLRQEPALAAELDQTLQRIRQAELAQLKQLDESGSAKEAMRFELKKLKDSGVFRDTAELLARAQTDPRVRAALDHAHEQAMHQQADILRDSTDELTREVRRLKQKLPPSPPAAPR